MLQVMARMIFNEYKFCKSLLVKVIKTTHHVINIVYLRFKLNKTSFELYYYKFPNIAQLCKNLIVK